MALAVVCVGGCSRTSFEEEAHGAVPPQRLELEADAGVASGAGIVPVGILPYALVGRSTLLPEGRRFDWPGSGLRVRFRGDALLLTLDERGSEELAVWIDAAVEPSVHVLRGGRNELRVPVGSGEHVVQIGKRSEARHGHFTLLGLEVEQGALLPIAARRRVEFLGDSISTGFGIEPTLPNGACTFASREQNAFATYAALFARGRDEDASLLAASSKTTREMTTLFERAWPAKDAPLWSFGESPAAVIVLLGTNDFFHRDPGQATFVHDYRTLLDRVRSRYGRVVPVVAALSPMLSDAYPAGAKHRTRGRKYLRTALKRARAGGDARLYSLEFDEPAPEEGLGCSAHPSAATHARMAATLSRLFEQEKL